MTHVWLLHSIFASGFRLVAPKPQENCVFRSTPEDRPENPHFIEKSEKPETSYFQTSCCVYLVGKRGLETPIFVVFPEGAKKGVQLFTLELPTRGFN